MAFNIVIILWTQTITPAFFCVLSLSLRKRGKKRELNEVENYFQFTDDECLPIATEEPMKQTIVYANNFKCLCM